LTWRDSRFFDPFTDKFINKGVRGGAALVVVFVPARAGFLAVSAEFANTIFE
jgi:hypothetical protein